ncbi:MAG TPA: ABC transporter permease [Candidatus Acidoferrales bacterium]|nr:ABC transporter permease [Candidatus Acidoferrales bacterium]
MTLPGWRRRQRDAELEEEIRSHLEMAARERIDRGEPEGRAREAARREFGNAGLVKEITREMWGWGSLERLGHDLRYGARLLAKAPGFAAIAVFTLALGIGANTALFSIVNGVLLRPLPFPQPSQLVALDESKPNFERGAISYANFLDWQRNNHTFSSMAVYRGFSMTFTGGGEAEQVRTVFITSDFFRMLGVEPAIGRTFLPGEDRIGAAPVALISGGFWARRFGSSPAVLGQAIALNGRDYTVVGVVPAGFRISLFGPSGRDVYVPLGQWQNNLLAHRDSALGIHGVGRLKPGVTIDRARADMSAVTRALAAEYPEADKGTGATLTPLKQAIVRNVRPYLLVLLAAVGFVLLIACANVANLLLARSTGRAREFALRAALGASQGRVIRQLLTESFLLAILGGGLGLLLAWWGTGAALAVLPTALPRAEAIGIDGRVLLATAAVSLLGGILFGLAPALKSSNPDLHEALKESGRGSSGARHRTQSIFVVAEMAMAIVLLVAAGLMIRSLAALWSVNPGFRPDNVLTFDLSLPPSMAAASPAAIRAWLRQVDRTLLSTPGVQAVSLSWGAFPMAGDDEELFWLEGQPKPASENEMDWALRYVVEPGYLQAMGIRLERGRFLRETDDEHAAPVIVVDDVFARKFFPNRDAIGQRIHLTGEGQDRLAEIVGVVGHVKQWGLDTDDTNSLRAQMYAPFMQLRDASMALVASDSSVVLRSAGQGPDLLTAARAALARMSGEQTVYRPETLHQILSDSLAARRYSMTLLAAFAALALLLASIGIYGVVSYAVGRRTREIGIRVALGAHPAIVLRLVLGQGAKVAVAGVAIGLAAALGLTHAMTRLLYGVSATDPLTYAGVAILLTLVALAACYLPARRAARVDPVVALRWE